MVSRFAPLMQINKIDMNASLHDSAGYDRNLVCGQGFSNLKELN